MSSRQRFCLCVLTCCVFLAGNCTTQGADGLAAFAISVEEFLELSPTDRAAVVTGAYERRLEHARNIHYEATQLLSTHKVHNDKGGELIEVLPFARWQHWRLGDSYRIDAERGRESGIAAPLKFTSLNFDSDQGIGRVTSHLSNRTRKYGRIAAKPDPLSEMNRYGYWLDGKHNVWSEYLFRYLVEHCGNFSFEAPVDGDKVRLTVPWKPIFTDQPLGTREFILDPSKGFLPVRGEAHWNDRREAQPSWRIESFTVESSQLVDGVWMPTKLKEHIRASTGKGTGNVYDITVTKIEAGNVTPEDLVVEFPSGTQVVDAIKRISYVAGDDGTPTPDSIEPILGKER